MSKPEFITFQFEKDDIKNLNLTPYLDTLERLVTSKESAFRFMHRVMFMVHGYDLDPRGLSVIPEVRTFFKELHTIWPYFLYFCIPIQDNFAWWMSVLFFPVVGREDGIANFMEVTPKTYTIALEDFFVHANGLAEMYDFPKDEYLSRQSEMVDAINVWCLGTKV